MSKFDPGAEGMPGGLEVDGGSCSLRVQEGTAGPRRIAEARSSKEIPILERDPKAIVREGYDRASHAYRGDEFRYEGSGYAYWLSRLTPSLPAGARILDLGCGNGIPVSRELARRYEVTGVDFSPVQIARARRLVPNARFLCADMTEVAFEPHSFEAVVAFFSLINLPLPEQSVVIERVCRWLVPGGRLLAIVGKWASIRVESDFRGVRGASMYWSHADLMTCREWFQRAGLRIEAEGSQPRNGNPGYAVLIAQSALNEEQHRKA